MESGLADLDDMGYEDYPYGLGGNESGRMPGSGMFLGGKQQRGSGDGVGLDSNQVGGMDQERGRWNAQQQQSYSQQQQQQHHHHQGSTVPPPTSSNRPSVPPVKVLSPPSPSAMSVSSAVSPHPAHNATHSSTPDGSVRMEEDPWPQYSRNNAGSVPAIQTPLQPPPPPSSFRYAPKEIDPLYSNAKDYPPLSPEQVVGGGAGIGLYNNTNRRDRVGSGTSGHNQPYGHGLPITPVSPPSSSSLFPTTYQPLDRKSPNHGINTSPATSTHDLPYISSSSTSNTSSSAAGGVQQLQSAARLHPGRSRSSQHIAQTQTQARPPVSPSHNVYGSSPGGMNQNLQQNQQRIQGGYSHDPYRDQQGNQQKSAVGGRGGQPQGQGQGQERKQGLRKIRDPSRDLNPLEALPNRESGRRADPNNTGAFLSVSDGK